MASQDSQSYLSKLSPWTRSPTVQPNKGKDGEPEPLLQQSGGSDHVVTHSHRLTKRNYPRDCPPLRPRWFHAVDAPKRRPNPAGKSAKEEKPPLPPKKYAPFSSQDSKSIETAYRKLSEEQNATRREGQPGGDIAVTKSDGETRGHEEPHPSLNDDSKPGRVKVPVNEDYLFDVDIEKRELAPAYWLGPVYDVRRGSWFYQDGSVQKPCDENLAEQLEDGYLKVEAWKLPTADLSSRSRSNSQPRRPTSWTGGLAPEETVKPAASVPITPQGSNPDLRKQAAEHATPPAKRNDTEAAPREVLHNTYRLFGAHMNSVVTYQDATTAWLLSDDFMSRMNYTVYQRFAGGGHLGGVKLTRGYVPTSKKAEVKQEDSTHPQQISTEGNNKAANEGVEPTSGEMTEQSTSESRRMKLERQMSSLLESTSSEDREMVEEQLRKRDEREMEEDYQKLEGEEQSREIEHLILVTHGIGQRLGLRLESVNFVHDINTLRKTIKAVYADSPDLRALNAELGKAEAVNSRIQVLPICWRHLLNFPKQALKRNRQEHDLADTELDDEAYPNLEDISVDGVPAVRNLITDLALDILLYQSPAYKDHISRIVLEECNRIYHLFMERNPNFKGNVSLIGHSLGSAIMFDLLCQQQTQQSKRHSGDQNSLRFDFAVDEFYALGSPIGLFQMLKGRTIVARQTVDNRRRAFSTSMDDPMLDSAALPRAKSRASSDIPPDGGPISSPKCGQIFNIFHPTDPISYRIEPLISPSMSSLKPQPLPYTKRGIFGAPMGQGFTGIGARVTQSVSSMWSNVASNLLTRGLGYAGEQGRVGNTQQPTKSSGPLSIGANTNNVTSDAIPREGAEIAKVTEASHKHDTLDAIPASASDQRPPVLIDSELETLYSGFQKRRKSSQSDAESRDLGSGLPGGGAEWEEAEERGKRLKREEEKVRALNSNGRVDYAIQEGAFDINLIAAIASHLSYWSDEDVSHFIASQVLSRRRVVKPPASNDAGT